MLIYIILVTTISKLIPNTPASYHILLGFSILTIYLITLFYSRKYQKMISAVELQNAIFANAMSQSTDFGAIIRYDGNIVYVTPEYRSLFDKYERQGHKGLDALLFSKTISKNDLKKIRKALAEGTEERMDIQLMIDEKYSTSAILSLQPIDIISEKDYPENIRLSMSPLSRPSGYFFLRATKYYEGQEKYNLLDSFNIGYLIINQEGIITTLNESAANLFGYSLKSWQKSARSIKEFIRHNEDKEEISSFKNNFNKVVQIRNKSGHIIRVLLSLAEVIDTEGNIEVQGVMLPIPANILETNSDYITTQEKNWFEYSPIATAILDSSGLITYSNEEFRRITDIKNVQSGKMDSFKELLEDDDSSNIEEWFKNISDGKAPTPIDAKLKSDETSVSLYLNNVKLNDTNSEHLILHIIDTTELKNLEMRFVHSQKMQAVGQLAGGIAHDFNNLLTAMIGFCDLLLLRHPAGDQSFADIMQIKQNANRAANLVRQLLAFSRKQTLQPKVISITNTLADLSNLITRLIGEKIEPEMNFGRNIGNVKVDQGQLEQVIVNLAVNARDAMPEGGKLKISTSNVTITNNKHPGKNMIPPAEDEIIENGDYVLISVEDSGEGIPISKIGKIFEPFYSTKKIGEGTGLGLATVYGIIKQTGGYIYVSSELGKGTTFSIFLKRCEGEVGKEDSLEEIEEKNSEDLTGAGTILIVEDEAAVRLFSMNALMNKGYNILEADNGEAALEVIKEHGKEINAIITDVVMPGINGPEMIQEVIKEYPKMKVIFVSGYAEDQFMKTYGDKRQFNFLPKPYTLKQLASKVKEVV